MQKLTQDQAVHELGKLLNESLTLISGPESIKLLDGFAKLMSELLAMEAGAPHHDIMYRVIIQDGLALWWDHVVLQAKADTEKEHP